MSVSCTGSPVTARSASSAPRRAVSMHAQASRRRTAPPTLVTCSHRRKDVQARRELRPKSESKLTALLGQKREGCCEKWRRRRISVGGSQSRALGSHLRRKSIVPWRTDRATTEKVVRLRQVTSTGRMEKSGRLFEENKLAKPGGWYSKQVERLVRDDRLMERHRRL